MPTMPHWGRVLKLFLLALFLTSGFFKADPRVAWIGVDLTLLTGGAVVAWCAASFVARKGSIPLRAWWLVALFTLFALPLLWGDLGGYGGDKAAKLLTLTLLSALAPFMLIRDRQDLRVFFWVLAGLGGVLALDAAWSVALGGGDMYRVTAFGSSTIALGRGVGIALLWVALLSLERQLPLTLGLPVACFLSVILLFSGSRGPFLSALGILVLLVVYLYRARPGRLMLGIGGIAALVFVMGLSSSLAPEGASQRISTFMQGELGGSELARLSFYEASWARIQETPQGLGWGGFSSEFGESDGQSHEYPHNLLLEVALEAGWAGAAMLVAVIAMAIRRGMRHLASTEARAALGLLLFCLANAFVSGDINDNKLLFAFLGVMLALKWEPAVEPAVEPLPLTPAAHA